MNKHDQLQQTEGLGWNKIKNLPNETNGRNKCEIRFQLFPVKTNVYINLVRGKNVTEIKILLGTNKKVNHKHQIVSHKSTIKFIL